MSKSIRVIHYDEQNVGKRIKSTKKHYMWKFALDEKIHAIDLFCSRMSGKKTLKIDGEKKFEGKKQGKIFHISFEITTHSILIIEVGKSYDLRIDGVSFQILQKQAIFSPDNQDSDKNFMSDKLIPDCQEDWEKIAKPYKIIIREGLSSTTREVLPIVKKNIRGRMTVCKPIDPRFLFATGNLLQDDLEVTKQRSVSTFQKIPEFENPFF